MVSKTNGALRPALALALALAGCPAWHSATPPRVATPSDAAAVACDPAGPAPAEETPCAQNGATCELDCRNERGYCVVLVCEQHAWRRLSVPPPQMP